MPDTGYSGRANNLEDYTDPYGGGDVPGPYGNLQHASYRSSASGGTRGRLGLREPMQGQM